MTAYYVNVADWTPEQVGDWMRGLDDNLLPYIHNFVEQGINGHRLLSASIEDIQSFRIEKLGHQEIFMSAVDLLRDFHFNLDRENLQFLAMQLGCKARSLYNELRPKLHVYCEKPEQVTTSTLAAVADIIDGVKDLVSWLDRAPFDGHEPYLEVKQDMLKLCLELATNAQRDLFAEHPVQVIREGCLKLVKISDGIVCKFLDPLVLQPASLDVATIKKKAEEDLVVPHSTLNYYDGIDLWIQGMLIQTSYKGVHVIGGVKFQSPAHQCGKIEEGDEVVQVNYQTVVGWQQKKLKAAMLENSTKVILTLKKRPRHSNNFGQIYVKPYRLPSKKRESYHFRWHLTCEGVKPEPAVFTKPADTVSSAPLPTVEIAPPAEAEMVCAELPSEIDSENDTDDDSFLPDYHRTAASTAAAASTTAASAIAATCTTTTTTTSTTGIATTTAATAAAASGTYYSHNNPTTAGNPSPASVRLILPKNRLSIQRRATVTGASPTSSRPPLSVEQFWKELWKEGIRCKGSENSGACIVSPSDYKKPDPRPHSSMAMAHYDAVIHDTDLNHSNKDPESSTSPVSVSGVRTELRENREICHRNPELKFSEDCVMSSVASSTYPENTTTSVGSKLHHSRLNKSQSTPAYESLVQSSFPQDKLLKEQFVSKLCSRVEEETLTDLENKSPSLISQETLPSPPALPPRNKTRLINDDEEVVASEPRNDNAYTGPSNPSPNDVSPSTHDSTFNSDESTSSQLYLGLRPREIRDLMVHGLWPRHPSDEDKALPALTRVTRLDSNFDPVPGSTVPRIAPSLLVSYGPMARCEEEVHVSLPPIKALSFHKSHYSPVTGRAQQYGSSGRTVETEGHRRVACRELGEGDCQGWLYRRRQTKGFFSGPRWTRRFFVLKKHTFYGYRDPEDQKAESFIYLPGFSSSHATEVKSKKFAFKIFNSNTVFYFACETKEELLRWFYAVQKSATAVHSHSNDPAISKENTSCIKGPFYSETEDESLDESENIKTSSLSSHVGKKEKSLAGLTQARSENFSNEQQNATDQRKCKSNIGVPRDKNGNSTVNLNKPLGVRSPLSASLDRKYLRFLRVAPEKQPIPTSQYRSYRRPSPASSPTTLVHPDQLPTFWLDSSKPPPRPPNEYKPTSPLLLLQPPSLSDSKPSTPLHSTPTILERHPLASPLASHTNIEFSKAPKCDESTTSGVRKCASASKLLGSNRNLRVTTDSISSSTNSVSRRNERIPFSTPEQTISRRHSVEISEAKKKHSRFPKTNNSLKQDETGIMSRAKPLDEHPVCDNTRRLGSYGSLNRNAKSTVNNAEISDYGKSGYAKIKPRKLSNVTDYSRSLRDTIGAPCGPSKFVETTQLGSQSASFISSSSKSLCSPTSLSPVRNRKETGGCRVDTLRGKESFNGSPDQLWISSLRSGTSPPAAPTTLTIEKSKNAGGCARLKSAACYQPMNFPLSPKDDSKMKAAFEMNLDVPTSTSSEPGGKSASTSDAKQFFKIFVSPKIGRKSTASTGVSKPQMPDRSFHEASGECKTQKTLLGSPRLHRAIFGHPKDKHKSSGYEGASSTKKPLSSSFPDQHKTQTFDYETSVVGDNASRNTSVYSNADECSDLLDKSVTIVDFSSNQVSAGVSVELTASLNDSDPCSCPDTPKTPSFKPAMGVSMIGKQRRTPVSTDSAFSSPPPSASSLRQTAQPNFFSYSVQLKESSLVSGPVPFSVDGLEYPPVFEPGTYSLSGKSVSPDLNSIFAAHSSVNNTLSPPIPAPRTKFLLIPNDSETPNEKYFPDNSEPNSF